MATEFRLPEKLRLRLLSFYQEQQAAIARLPESAAYVGALAIAMDVIGLDPAQRNHVNLDTGVVTPAATPTKPELVKEEEAAS